MFVCIPCIIYISGIKQTCAYYTVRRHMASRPSHWEKKIAHRRSRHCRFTDWAACNSPSLFSIISVGSFHPPPLYPKKLCTFKVRSHHDVLWRVRRPRRPGTPDPLPALPLGLPPPEESVVDLVEQGQEVHLPVHPLPSAVIAQEQCPLPEAVLEGKVLLR